MKLNLLLVTVVGIDLFSTLNAYNFHDTLTYDDCKATQRCSQGLSYYDLESVSVRYGSTQFLGGQQNSEYIFSDFENGSQGTLNWKVPLNSQENIPDNQKLPAVPHFNSRNLPLLHSFESYWEQIDGIVATRFGNSTSISNKWCVFDTQAVSLRLFANLISNSTGSWNGTKEMELLSVPGLLRENEQLGTPAVQVAVFNFESVNIQSHVDLRAVGKRPLAILSRSSVFFNTTLDLAPGAAGGFPGATGEEHRVNVNGPGSSSMRVYPFTLVVGASAKNEVQTISTSADRGQTLRGAFVLGVSSAPEGTAALRRRVRIAHRTRPIAHNESPRGVKQAIESSLGELVGEVAVQRSQASDEGGYTWTVEFTSHNGDVPPLEVVPTPTLLGEGARASTATTRQASQVGGAFSLRFGEQTSRAIPVDASAAMLTEALREDFGGVVEWARVEEHNLPRGLDRTKGKLWHVLLATKRGNTEASSPVAVGQASRPGLVQALEVVDTALTGDSPVAFVLDTLLGPHSAELAQAHAQWTATGTVQRYIGPFTVAPGGHGGSLAGAGGGFMLSPTAAVSPAYAAALAAARGSPGVLGGSGGAVGGGLGAVANLVARGLQAGLGGAAVAGVGGGGGGFLEIVAELDVTIGTSGRVSADGGRGGSAAFGGGGGSGGSVLVFSRSGSVLHRGVLRATGGDGGNGMCPAVLVGGAPSVDFATEGPFPGCGREGLPGGGGGGGLVLLQGPSVSNAGTVSVIGGRSGNLLARDSGEVSPGTTDLAGRDGLARVETLGGRGMAHFRDHQLGAAGTKGSLAIRVAATSAVGAATRRGRQTLDVGGVHEGSPVTHLTQPWSQFGVLHAVAPLENVTASSGGPRPERVSTFLRIHPHDDSELQNSWGAFVALHEPIASQDPHDIERSTSLAGRVIVGVGVVEGMLRHGSGLPVLEDIQDDSKSREFFKPLEKDKWYKLDVFVNWHAREYDIRVDDVEAVVAAPLELPSDQTYAGYLGLYGANAMQGGGSTWYDEVFVGRSYMVGFRCPQTRVDKAPESGMFTHHRVAEARAERATLKQQANWGADELGPQTSYSPMTHHSSHLSRQRYYEKEEVSGIKHGDGLLHRRFFSEVDHEVVEQPAAYAVGPHGQEEATTLSRRETERAYHQTGRDSSNLFMSAVTKFSNHRNHASGGLSLLAGDASDVPPATADSREALRYHWFSEHHNPVLGNTTWLAGRPRPPPHEAVAYPPEALAQQRELVPSVLLGGIASCSTQDFVEWRNQGIVLNFANVTYHGGVPRTQVVVQGGVDGVGVPTAGRQHRVEVPVTSIHRAGNWSQSALYAQRPKVLFNNLTERFVLWSEVHDYAGEVGVAATASAKHPAAPFRWERSFLPDGNETFEQSVFHDEGGEAFLIRTYYATVDYLLPEPVMQPLWESIKSPNGSIDFGLTYHRATYDLGYDDSDDICVQRLRKEDVPEETLRLNVTADPAEWMKNIYSNETRQQEPWVAKEIVGQGDPIVTSRFKNPNITANNAWLPNSVPSVKAQSWSQNYQDHNVADNPVHPTFADKLIGPPQVVEQRRTRYLAISRLSPDFLSTSGELAVVEGGLTAGDLIHQVADPAGLSWTLSALQRLTEDGEEAHTLYPRRSFPGKCDGGAADDDWEDCNQTPVHDKVSTEPGQVWGLDAPFNFVTEYDWSWRYHQFRWTEGDRSDAPVNFKDQLVEPFEPGRGTESTTKARDFIREYDYNCFRGATTHLPEDDPNYQPADALFMNPRSQRYTKTEGIDTSHTEAHLLGW